MHLFQPNFYPIILKQSLVSPFPQCRLFICRILFTDGPSFNKLFANDQILKVNGMDVRDSPQVDVISLIKYVNNSIQKCYGTSNNDSPRVVNVLKDQIQNDDSHPSPPFPSPLPLPQPDSFPLRLNREFRTSNTSNINLQDVSNFLHYLSFNIDVICTEIKKVS